MSATGGAIAGRGARRLVTLAALLAALLLAACSGGGAGHARTGGRVVTFAEQPGQPPSYLLPLESPAEESNANFAQFSNILYPPLYVFDAKGKPALDEALSVGKPPKFSDNNSVVTIQLKHWVWSNGKPITSRDVVFWLNLLGAVTDPNAPTIGSSTAPGPGWGFFVPGGFPQNVVSYRSTGTYSIALHLNGSYNPTWFLFNELSQITPVPQASWDKLSATSPVGSADLSAQTRVRLSGSSPALYVPRDPGTATSGALGVAQFLNLQAQNVGTYAKNPLWKVVSGAFSIAQYTTQGFLKLVPNSSYSGTPKPRIAAFEELPFTTDSAEYLAVRSGSVTIGYIPPQDINQKAALERQQGYSFSPWNVYGIGYAAFNFTNPTTGPLFRQQYFRAALQSLVDQKQYISRFDGGYGSPTVGPVPSTPVSKYTSPLEKSGGPYHYNPARAVSLLSANGWKVTPGGTSFCQSPGTGPGECGAGISRHQSAAFTLLYASGNTAGTDTAQALQSTAGKSAGITVTLKSAPFTQVIGTMFAGCTASTPCSNWDVADLFVGWTFGPDYLPTGGEIFGTGAGSNAGNYSDPTNDANITATHTAASSAAEVSAMFKYEDYLARQLPVLWTPISPLQLTVYKSSLHGLVPQGIIDQVFPQFYR